MMKRKRFSLLQFLFFFTLLLGCTFSVSSCSNVSISDRSINLYVDDTYSLTARSSDEDALVLWKSSDNNVAIVRRGKITAVGKGECNITAYDDNGAKATCHVKVDAMDIKISHSSKQVDIGHLNNFVLNAEAEDGGEITWSYSNNTLARVDKGRVTCLDTGNVVITAYRKGGKATCSVSIFDSARADDYYVMNKGQMATVIADPGVWYYWPNGSSTVTKAVYQNSGFVSNITSLDGNGVYYRYQPKAAVGASYTVSFRVMLNVTTTLTGKKNTSVTANEWANYSYTGTVSSSEPFYFTVKNVDIPSSGAIVVTVTDIVVSGESGPNPPTGGYEVVAGKNADVCANPGVWYYWANGSDKVSTAHFSEDGVLTASITKLNDSQGMYFRYQPGGSDGTNLSDGDQYTISFKITMSQAGTVQGKSSATVTNPGEFVNYTWTGAFSSSSPFNFTIKNMAVPTNGSIDITAKDFVITAHQSEQSSIETGTQSDAIAHPGTWYLSKGSGDTISSGSETENSISLGISALASSDGIKLYYQPGGNASNGLLVGDDYTISGSIKMNTTGTVGGSTSTVISSANTATAFTYSAIINTESVFVIELKNISVPTGGLTVNITGIKFTSLKQGTMAVVKENPGIWHYNSAGSAAFNVIPRRSHDLSVNGSSIGVEMKTFNGDHFYFRYQPGGADGTGCVNGSAFRLTFTLLVSFTGTVQYGCNGDKTVEMSANVAQTIVYEGTVSDQIFYIKLDKALTTPVAATVSNISVEAI